MDFLFKEIYDISAIDTWKRGALLSGDEEKADRIERDELADVKHGLSNIESCS